jgi:hypothetical protein
MEGDHCIACQSFSLINKASIISKVFHIWLVKWLVTEVQTDGKDLIHNFNAVMVSSPWMHRKESGRI